MPNPLTTGNPIPEPCRCWMVRGADIPFRNQILWGDCLSSRAPSTTSGTGAPASAMAAAIAFASPRLHICRLATAC